VQSTTVLERKDDSIDTQDCDTVIKEERVHTRLHLQQGVWINDNELFHQVKDTSVLAWSAQNGK